MNREAIMKKYLRYYTTDKNEALDECEDVMLEAEGFCPVVLQIEDKYTLSLAGTAGIAEALGLEARVVFDPLEGAR